MAEQTSQMSPQKEAYLRNELHDFTTKITNLRLFHNHMAIEPVLEIFGYYDGHIVEEIREIVFREFAASENEGRRPRRQSP